MDPNETLNKLRKSAKKYHNSGYGSLTAQDAADKLMEHFSALDEWLTKGGLLPEDWSSR